MLDEYGGTTISPSEEARIREEVRTVMKEQFASARANVLARNKSSKTGNASAENEVIDLITQSVASLQNSQPSVLPSSPISVASPLPKLGMVGALRDFRICHLLHTPHLPRHLLPQCIGGQRSLHAFLDAVPRMSIHGHLWCVTTSPSWGAVTPNKSPTR